MADNENIRCKQRFQNFEKVLTIFKDRCLDVKEQPKGAKYYDAFQMALVQAVEKYKTYLYFVEGLTK